jgi:DNA-binding transcriptional MerR regulator
MSMADVGHTQDDPPIGGPPEGRLGEVGLSGTTASRLAGVTFRQLDYWARSGLVVPSISSTMGGGAPRRLYSPTDLVELRVIKRLLDGGVSLRQIRDAIGYLRKEAADQPVSDLTLMSDGNRIYACRSAEEVVDVLSNGQAVFGIAVGRVLAETEEDLAHLPANESRGSAGPNTEQTRPAGEEVTYLGRDSA